MEFRLTYAGRLPAFKNNKDKQLERTHEVHRIRRCFHKQLKELWAGHPVLREIANGEGPDILTLDGKYEAVSMIQVFQREGFNWRPMVTEENGLICRLEILMLRPGHPGQVVFDIDNRLKTLFDALRMAKNPAELGERSRHGRATPDGPDEDPFFVLLEDDSLITHLAVTTDALLEPLDPCHGVAPQDQVRIVVSVTVRPYRVKLENAGYV